MGFCSDSLLKSSVYTKGPFLSLSQVLCLRLNLWRAAFTHGPVKALTELYVLCNILVSLNRSLKEVAGALFVITDVKAANPSHGRRAGVLWPFSLRACTRRQRDLVSPFLLQQVPHL